MQYLISPRQGPRRADAVLLIATTMERLRYGAGGKAWFDPAAQVYAQRVGISLIWRRAVPAEVLLEELS